MRFVMSDLKRERVSFDHALRAEHVRAKQVGALPSSDCVIKLLTSAHVEFDVTTHAPELETHKTAGQVHITGKRFGKATLVHVEWPESEERPAEVIMCILRSMDQVVLSKVAKVLSARTVRLCTGTEVQEIVARSGLAHDAPAVPPLPSMLQLSGLMDADLAAAPVIYFKAGNTHQLVSMKTETFRYLTSANVASIAEELDLHVKPLTTMIVRSGLSVPNCFLRHPPAATATEAAKALHFPGTCTLKAVVVKLDGKNALCAIPCTRAVDLPALRKLANAHSAALTGAAELRESIPATQYGPLPPFGHLFGMETFVDTDSESGMLSGPVDVAFSAGTPTVSMTMRFGDFIRILRHYGDPVTGSFTSAALAEITVATGAQFKKHLQERGIPFMTVKHARAFTASQTAAEAQISGHQLAKTVIVTDGRTMAMVAVSACDRVDLAALSALAASNVHVTGAGGSGDSFGAPGSSCSSTEALLGGVEDSVFETGPQLRLATEAEFADMFDDVEPGAMPPFGHLYQQRTFVDERLAEHDTIYMNAGNHKVLLEVAWKDFVRLVQPTVGSIAQRRSSSSGSA